MQKQISAREMPVVVGQLLAARRYSDAIQVLLAFMAKGVVSFPMIETAVRVLYGAAREDGVTRLLEELKRRFPDSPDTWRVVFVAAGSGNKWELMLQALDRFEACGGDGSRYFIQPAHALERIFEPHKALEVLEPGPPQEDGGRSHWHYVRASCLSHLKRTDEARTELESFLEGAPDNVHTAASWILYGRLLDSAGEYEAAFAAFQAGNQLALRLYPVPLAENPLGRRIRGMREVFTPQWVASWLPAGEPPRTPVFLVGFPRSGTTLLDQILDSHPDIQTLEEQPTVESVWEAMAPMLAANLEPGGLPEDECGRRRRHVAEISQIAKLSPAQVETLRGVYFAAVGRYTCWESGRTFVDKMPLNTVSVGLLVRLFPEARFIVALRHPCDTILSNFMQDFAMNPGMQYMASLDSAAALYTDLMKLLWQFIDVCKLEERVHFTRYEDTVDDMPSETRRVLDFLGLPWHDAVLEYAEHARQRGALATPSYLGVTQGIYRRSVNRWHNYAAHLKPVLPVLGPACERYGYSLALPDEH